MSGELISRKNLMQCISSYQMSVAKVGNEREYAAVDLIYALVENFKTAYDLDNVIQQIGEIREDLIMGTHQNARDYSQEIISELAQLIDEYTEEIIKIVKSGGIDGKNGG